MTRIDRLESLLVSAMATNGQLMTKAGATQDAASQIPNVETHENPAAESSNPQRSNGGNSLDVDGMIKGFGSMKVDVAENSSIYLGGIHWVSIMSEIDEFRTFIENNHEAFEQNALHHCALSKDVKNSPSLLRGTTTPASREELESYVPSKDVADMLMNRFFSFYGLTLRTYHCILQAVH